MKNLWEEYNTGREITSAFVTLSSRDWVYDIRNLGWEIDSIDQDADGYWVVQASSPKGEQTETKDKNRTFALASLYSRINRSQSARLTHNQRVADWDRSFHDQVEEVAHEYADAKFYDKKAAPAWTELARDNKNRANMIREQLTVDITDHPLPYKTFNEMADDVIKNKKFTVSQANAEHPIWSKDQVVDFRIVNDVLGHIAAGADWSWFGMNRAFAAHAPLLSVEAQKALFTETIGRGAFNSYYRSMADSKIVFLKSFDEVQKIENKSNHRETHPSQSLVPTEIPKIDKQGSAIMIFDPNHGFESGVEPLDNNAFMWQHILNDIGEFADPLNLPGLKEVVNELDPRWQDHHDDSFLIQMVANAIRAALTNNGSDPERHAQHYQAIHHIPAGCTDPLVYWDALNGDRSAHNMARGYMEVGKEADPFINPLMQQIKNLNPHLHGEDLHNEARKTLFNMRAEEESIAKDKLGHDAHPEKIADDGKARLVKRLKILIKPNYSDDHDFTHEQMIVESNEKRDPRLYPSPLASNIKPLSDIAEHLDDLSNAAKEDLMKNGQGHHFRSTALQKDIDGFGPDKISEAWFYLAPYLSQLGILTPSVIKSLGHKPDELHPRDYFKLERQLQAGRDASGYNHVPLGQFSHGLNNTMHYQNGHHPSQSHVNPVNPTKHYHKDWATAPKPSIKPVSPGWWNDTKPARKQVGKNWDKAVAIKHPKTTIPYKTADMGFTGILNAWSPYLNHPETGQRVIGQPGQSAMQHAMTSMQLGSPMDVWSSQLDIGKEAIGSANN